MKRTLVVLLCLFSSAKVWSQSVEPVKDSVMVENTDKYKVETNHFFNNLFIGAGVGGQLYFGDHNRQMKFGELLTPGFELYLGKWFSPGIGVRLALNGVKIKGATQNGSHSTGEMYDPSKGLMKHEFNYYHVHGDVLFNLTNLIRGYKEDRFYSLSPYVGLGLMHSYNHPVESEVSANLGVLNSFRVSEAIDLTFDLRGTMVNDRFDGETGGRENEGMLTAAVGVKYTFNKRNWERSKTTIIRYSDEELNALRTRVNELANDNEALRKQLAEAGNKSITDVVVKNRVIAAPVLLTFPIGNSTVSNEMRVNLGYLANVIKDGNAEVKYRVTGYADSETGLKSTNDRISKERAQAVFNVLVKEFGVSASQIVVSHKGGVKNMFYNDPRLNRAVITIAD